MIFIHSNTPLPVTFFLHRLLRSIEAERKNALIMNFKMEEKDEGLFYVGPRYV